MVSLVLAACGSGGSAKRTAASSTSSTSSPSVTTGGTSTTTTTSSSVPTTGGPTTVGPATGGPVPAGFVPSSVTAVSTTTFWVLGQAPCASPPCTSVVRTNDGGAHFVGIPAPRAPLATNGPPQYAQDATAVSSLRFADDRNGWAFGPALWATHDGGQTWHQVPLPGKVIDLAAAGGQVWALGGDCPPNQGCGSFWLRRSPVGQDQFQPVALPVPLTGPAPAPAIALQGSTVYLLVNSASTGGRYRSTLLVSGDGGQHFARRQAPCEQDLGGSLSAAPDAVWAVCPTGMQSQIWRSTDGGLTFANVRTPTLTPNSAQVAPARGGVAVLVTYGTRVWATADGGQSWAQAQIPANLTSTDSAVFYVGMSDSSVGFALLSGPAPNTKTLLRSADGGRQWAGVAF